MSEYLSVLRIPDYRKLWVGSLLSLLGDGAAWTALVWLALNDGGIQAVGILGVCYTLPVMLGGALVGPMLDRFSRRTLLIADNVVRCLVMVSVPIVAVVGDVRVGLLYAVAAIYGLLKIVPLGVVPAVVPELVPKDKLQPAAALETIGYGVAGLAGPALGGLLIVTIGGANVLAIDAATYALFALLVLSMKARLPRPAPEPVDATSVVVDQSGRGWRPAIQLVTRDKVLLAITSSFMAFNFVFGMITVTVPWLVKFELGDRPELLGLLLAVLAGAELVGSFVAGALKPADRQMLRMGTLQTFAGFGLLFLLLPSLPTVLAGLVVIGLLSAPVTVASLALRMSRIPAVLRGRTMTLMRTLMNGTPPLGAAVAASLLSAGLYTVATWLMVAVATLPGIAVALVFRNAVFKQALAPETAPNPQPYASPELAAVSDEDSPVPNRARATLKS